MTKCDFNKVAKQLYVFSCKFTAYFQNDFSREYLWTAASDLDLGLITFTWLTGGSLY